MYNKCLCHDASLIQMETPVTNNVGLVGDSRCHHAILAPRIWLGYGQQLTVSEQIGYGYG